MTIGNDEARFIDNDAAALIGKRNRGIEPIARKKVSDIDGPRVCRSLDIDVDDAGADAVSHHLIRVTESRQRHVLQAIAALLILCT